MTATHDGPPRRPPLYPHGTGSAGFRAAPAKDDCDAVRFDLPRDLATGAVRAQRADRHQITALVDAVDVDHGAVGEQARADRRDNGAHQLVHGGAGGLGSGGAAQQGDDGDRSHAQVWSIATLCWVSRRTDCYRCSARLEQQLGHDPRHDRRRDRGALARRLPRRSRPDRGHSTAPNSCTGPAGLETAAGHRPGPLLDRPQDAGGTSPVRAPAVCARDRVPDIQLRGGARHSGDLCGAGQGPQQERADLE